MKQQIDLEEKWYINNPWIKRDHFLMKWPFFHSARHDFAYKYARSNVRKILSRYLFSKTGKRRTPKALVAPCGTAADQDILFDLAYTFYGIDVSPEAVIHIPKNIEVKVADILDNGYESDFFDLVASFLFFHHLNKVGFVPFLREFKRILKNDGILVLFEPSAFYPVSWLTNIGRKLFGNISGLVPDESPIIPSKLDRALIEAGFKIEKFESVSFSHNRIPLPVQHMINAIINPLRCVYPFNKMGWLCIWICTKI